MDDIDNELQTLGGREYYANSKIAYLMPKDADGMSSKTSRSLCARPKN